ncbi:DUF6920 family protein [Leminorella grimontii]|uniref:DUF6920 family protein n=1 Tax=Leminorella grimontii TaxID=82981 RepID=UPI00321F953B
MQKSLFPKRRILIAVGLTIAVIFIWIACAIRQTERDIATHVDSVRKIAMANDMPPEQFAGLAHLPTPVQKYLRFAVPNPQSAYRLVNAELEGQFRRPLMTEFSPTSANLAVAIGEPAMLFSAKTSMELGLWAKAYDFFANGRMEMRAKIASAIAVVDEKETPELNRTSLRRWLLESPLYPLSLFPGGPVRWESIDDTRARAIVSGFGMETSLIATFRPDGSLEAFFSEEDGDLTTPYHGSGEYALRNDYRLVQGMMIPHSFEIARASKGQRYPFWRGKIRAITFE